MNNKTLLIFILTIFCIGMTMGSATASHTYHKGGYTFTVSDNQYKKIQEVKKGNFKDVNYYIKTKHTKTVKVPKYKNKKVTKYKWKHKKVVYEYITWYPYKGVKVSNLKDYYNNGWKKYSSGSNTLKNNKKYGAYNYVLLKKKVPYTTTVKVKNGYKNVRCPVYALIAPGDHKVGVCFTVEKGNYFDFISKEYWL